MPNIVQGQLRQWWMDIEVDRQTEKKSERKKEPTVVFRVNYNLRWNYAYSDTDNAMSF